MSTEKPVGHNNSSGRTPEEEERIRSIIRAIGFIFLAVVIWYGFDLASL